MFDVNRYLENQPDAGKIAEILKVHSSFTKKQQAEIRSILCGQNVRTKDIQIIVFFENSAHIFMSSNETQIPLEGFLIGNYRTPGVNWTMPDILSEFMLIFNSPKMERFGITLSFPELRYFVDCFLKPKIEVSTLNAHQDQKIENLGLVSGTWDSEVFGGVSSIVRGSKTAEYLYLQNASPFLGSEMLLLIEAWNLRADLILGVQTSATTSSDGLRQRLVLTGTAFRRID